MEEKWNIKEQDGVNGREMEYVGARWCEWKVNGIFGSEMVSGREMEYLGARWCE